MVPARSGQLVGAASRLGFCRPKRVAALAAAGH